MSNLNSIYFDCKTGVSGDMVLGSLVCLGINTETLKLGLSKLKLGNFQIEAREEIKYGTIGTNIYFKEVTGQDQGSSEGHEHEHEHEHSHRTYREIEKIITESDLSEGIKRRAVEIYEAIASAEAVVHETDIENVHFHEVGRKTAILNIVGVAICLELLGVEKIYCSEIHDGTGFVKCSHGLIPVPVPAVKELLKNTGFKLIQEDVNMEMITPSGLGILKGLQAIYLDKIPSGCLKSGNGFGKRDSGKLSVLTAYLLDKS